MSSSNNRLRWWPLAIIVVLTILAVVWIWTSAAPQRQARVFQTVSVLLTSFLLILLWLLFLSRLRWKVRLISLGVIALMLGLSPVLFRFRGFSGDLVPILEWRWAKKAGRSLITTLEKDESVSRLSPSDYPQFLGPNRNATVGGIQLARDWSNRPPRLVWRHAIGAGWSAFAIVGNSAITQEQRGEWEMVVCYDLKSGKEKWSHRNRARFDQMPAGVGPRATPTIMGNRVYTLGATGILNCLEFETGKGIWSVNIIHDNNAKMPPWGMSGSPLVLGDRVVVSAGGPEGKSLVAYHKDTGERVWSGGNARSGYSSPQITTVAGVRQILIFNYGNVAAHEPLTGQILWQHPWAKVECVAQPVPLPGDRVFVSSGYGIGGKLFQIQRDEKEALQVSLVWETPRLKAKFTNVVYRDGYIYGLDDGVLVCLDITNGQRKWKRGRYGHGQVILVDDLLLVQAESGDVILVEVNPHEHKELARFPALEGKTWNSPALAGPYLLVRNDREAACYELPLE
ncbi:PQQ-like beta-propeller repeat protein [Candidatus Poribacteria bacterium]|nr:PQQ-like beta-propeller repeat protein [Candidatus Poribacteria bacterium]